MGAVERTRVAAAACRVVWCGVSHSSGANHRHRAVWCGETRASGRIERRVDVGGRHAVGSICRSRGAHMQEPRNASRGVIALNEIGWRLQDSNPWLRQQTWMRHQLSYCCHCVLRRARCGDHVRSGVMAVRKSSRVLMQPCSLRGAAALPPRCGEAYPQTRRCAVHPRGTAA